MQRPSSAIMVQPPSPTIALLFLFLRHPIRQDSNSNMC